MRALVTDRVQPGVVYTTFHFPESGANVVKLRLPTHGGFYVWDFYKDGRELKVRIRGRGAFNTIGMMRQAALDGFGIAFLPEDQVEAAIQDGRLMRVLADWCPPRPAYHLYYPSRRQHSPAFALVIEALRHRG